MRSRGSASIGTNFGSRAVMMKGAVGIVLNQALTALRLAAQKAMLKNALVAKCEDLLRRPSIPRCDTRTDFEMLAEFRWAGHWEVWESEWGDARWIWD